MQVRILPQDGHIQAYLDGLVSVDAWSQGLSDLEDGIRDLPGDRLVVDLAGLVGWLGVPERTTVGALWATHLARMKRVALVIQPEKIVGVVEAEARRLGLDLRLFPDFAPALEWVLANQPSR